MNTCLLATLNKALFDFVIRILLLVVTNNKQTLTLGSCR